MSYWKYILKPEVEANIEKAGITDKGAIKTILTLERRVNTCRNAILRGHAWDTVCYSDAYDTASRCFDKLNLNSYGKKDAQYWTEWCAYCEASGIEPTANLGDWLA